MTTPITETSGADCLLVVDSSEAEIQLLRSMLVKLGFEIWAATSGAQALKLLAARKPDLILLDLLMPDMDGFGLTRRIQEHPEWKDVPVIFLSAADDKELIVRALESGGVDYITKPFHKQELLSRVRTQLMLKTSRDYARRLAQDKDELLGIISHHFQNHLVGVCMGAQILSERAQAAADPRMRLMADNIRASSGQMRAFVKAFLANSASDHALSFKMEPVSFGAAAARSLKEYEDVAAAKTITFRTDISNQDTQVLADAAALAQVLDNLISNAIKFSPRGKEVSVVVQRKLEYVECHIQDQGAGFTEEDKARMFGRYARLSARPTGGEPSTGLGLSIAKKLMRALAGELFCESEPGHGAKFILRLAHNTVKSPDSDSWNLLKVCGHQDAR